MKKYTATLLVLTSIILVFSFGSPLISLYNFSNIEREEVEDDVLQARNILEAEVKQLSVTAADYSGWDDAYAFMQDHNPKFVSSSLGEAFYSKQRFNVYCMINTDGDIVLGRAHDYQNNTKLPIPASLQALITPGSFLLRHVSPEDALAGFLALPEGLLMIVSQPILTSEYRGPVRGTLIVGRFLGDLEIRRISKLLEFDITVLNAAMSGSNPVFKWILEQLPGKEKVHVQVEGEDKIAGYAHLTDIQGKVAGLIKLEKPRKIYLQAKQATWRFIVLYGAFCCLVAIVFTMLSRKLTIISRSDQQRQRQLSAMAFDLSIAEERERCRIAEELHDQVGPTLLLAKMKADALKSQLPTGEYESYFESIDELIDQSVQDIRSLTFQLRPPILANAGLEAALKWLAQEIGQKYDLLVKLNDDKDFKPLKYEVRSIVFQAVRELLLNVVKHAETRNAAIDIKRESDTMVVTVEDDGIGFHVGKNAEGKMNTNGFGIFNIRNKIEYLGGRMTIDSSPGSGTRVSLTVPLEISTPDGDPT